MESKPLEAKPEKTGTSAEVYDWIESLVSAIIMWLIGLRKPVPLLLISFLVPLGVWLVFYKVLAVNIPMGPLQFLRDLVDKI